MAVATNVRVSGFGPKYRLAILGAIILLWLPRISDASSFLFQKSNDAQIQKAVFGVGLINNGNDDLQVFYLGEFFVTPPQTPFSDQIITTGRFKILTTNSTADEQFITVPARGSLIVVAEVLNPEKYSKMLEAGDLSFGFIVRVNEGRRVISGEVPFNQEVLQKHRIDLVISEVDNTPQTATTSTAESTKTIIPTSTNTTAQGITPTLPMPSPTAGTAITSVQGAFIWKGEALYKEDFLASGASSKVDFDSQGIVITGSHADSRVWIRSKELPSNFRATVQFHNEENNCFFSIGVGDGTKFSPSYYLQLRGKVFSFRSTQLAEAGKEDALVSHLEETVRPTGTNQITLERLNGDIHVYNDKGMIILQIEKASTSEMGEFENLNSIYLSDGYFDSKLCTTTVVRFIVEELK